MTEINQSVIKLGKLGIYLILRLWNLILFKSDWDIVIRCAEDLSLYLFCGCQWWLSLLWTEALLPPFRTPKSS